MVVLGESVVSARVKKYFFAQRTMTEAPNVFLPLEKQELNVLFYEIKSCFEISLRIQPFLLAPPPPEVDVSPGPEDQGRNLMWAFPRPFR